MNGSLKKDPTVRQFYLYSKAYGSSGYVRIPAVPEAYVHTHFPGSRLPWQKRLNCLSHVRSVNFSTAVPYFRMPEKFRNITFSKEHGSVWSWEDYMQKYQGRSGHVLDWSVPKGLSSDKSPYCFKARHGLVEDTMFRNTYRAVLADNSLPPPVRVISGRGNLLL